MAEIILKSGEAVLVDEDDFAWLSKRKWFAARSAGGVYASCGTPYAGPHNRMHRVIINPSAGMVVDHINGNTLDNRRANLRACTQTQNMWNTKDRKDRRVSACRGMFYDGPGKWYARIMVSGVTYRSGPFATEVEAARAYDDLALEKRGAFARLNFPLGEPS